MRALCYALALISLGLSSLLYIRIRSPLGLGLWPLKILAGSLAAFTAAGGVLGALLGLALRSPVAVAAGAAGAALSATYLWRMAALGRGCALAPGLPAHAEESAARRRGVASVRVPVLPPPPRWQRDVPFWTLDESGRQLLCDLWQPPLGVQPSGIALVYLHSSAWHMADKDLWTRPLFRHLAARGHVVMDVAYRLCPEVDLYGMQADSRRAIAWIKANGARYGVDPGRVVAAGASAGGHLALLAAYTPGHPALTPSELRGVDTTVRAAVSFYGLVDLRAYYAHVEAILPPGELLKRLAPGPVLQVAERAAGIVPGYPFAGQTWKLAYMSNRGILTNLLGGTPDEVPAAYDLASPITHAGPHCPPTLLIQGEDDAAVPVAASHALLRSLAAAGVPAVSVILPHTDHIFDLVLPQVSPPARVALAALDRFLASVT